LSFCVITNML